MPWAPAYMPSFQIATLQAFLKQHGISSDTKSLYLDFANMIGFNQYYYIPQDQFLANALFSACIHKEMRPKISKLFKKYYKGRSSFSNLLKTAELFLAKALSDIPFHEYEYIGFSTVFSQLFPSLALSKLIKIHYPATKIIFGGYNCCAEKGKSLMTICQEIDYIISYEGEIPLLNLLSNKPFKEIGGLTYRENGCVRMNPPNNEVVPLDDLDTPDYNEYFNSLKGKKRLRRSKTLNNFVCVPMQVNRGCWWNKCTFCNLNIQYQRYREKHYKKTIREVAELKNKYNVNYFVIISNIMNLNNNLELFNGLKPLGINILLHWNARLKDYSLFKILKDSGVILLQFGLESLSKSLLENKINKGVRLIDNIQVLKYLREFNIASETNIITKYPNESKREFRECIENFKSLYHLETPYSIDLKLVYGSYIYSNPNLFNIREISLDKKYEYFMPKTYLEKNIFDEYTFKQKIRLVHPFKVLKKELDIWFKKFFNSSAYPLLYYEKGHGYILIIDRRYKKIVKYILNKDESDVYVFCHSIKNIDCIYKEFIYIEKTQIKHILDVFLEKRLMFKEDTEYLSLAINLKIHKKYLVKDGYKLHRYIALKHLIPSTKT